MSFPTPLNVNPSQLPAKIWNNLGHEPRLGAPDFPSMPAPHRVLHFETGVGVQALVTFQGFILDDASAIEEGVSITNAIVLDIDTP